MLVVVVAVAEDVEVLVEVVAVVVVAVVLLVVAIVAVVVRVVALLNRTPMGTTTAASNATVHRAPMRNVGSLDHFRDLLD